jgi:N-methylhydantoinase B/oxoprolinase/acetone carboxylase alpha subunit
MRIRDGLETPIAPKSDAVRLLKGDIVRLETSGGGGFGDPAKRSAEQRHADHALGYVKG